MPGPAVYRHKPTIIHAMQYTRPNVPLLSAWLARTWPGGYQFSGDDSHLLIETPEGDRDCSIEEGYWIAEGIRGECYCIRCDIFAASYELVGEA